MFKKGLEQVQPVGQVANTHGFPNRMHGQLRTSHVNGRDTRAGGNQGSNRGTTATILSHNKFLQGRQTGLTGNFAGFHQASGAGYTFVADWLAKLDPVNPQTAARMATVFETMQMFDGDRQSLMRDALERLRVNPSRDMGEITARILKA